VYKVDRPLGAASKSTRHNAIDRFQEAQYGAVYGSNFLVGSIFSVSITLKICFPEVDENRVKLKGQTTVRHTKKKQQAGGKLALWFFC
jgi:hypothetical protein